MLDLVVTAYVWCILHIHYILLILPVFLVANGIYLYRSIFPNKSPIAQSVEHSAVNRSVVGSSPTRGATKPSKPVVDSYGDEFKLPANPFED